MMFIRPRHLARFRSERVANTDEVVPNTNTHSNGDVENHNDAPSDEEDSFVNDRSGDVTTNISSNNNISPSRQPDDIETGSRTRSSQQDAVAPVSDVEEREDVSIGESDDDDEIAAVDGTEGTARHTVRHTVSLAELEEERELARRRSSACVLFALFILFRMWILALQEGDFGLLLLCLLGSSWTARWVRYNRDQEEELDRRISNYLVNAEDGNVTGVERDDLRMLSFQAQLALAIMESQRQMMQGGHGHPDGNANQNPGVSENARGKWKKFAYKEARDKNESRRGSYGSVAQQDVSKPGTEDEPQCSICLSEYEEGEGLTTLPCGHIYHDECIASWCTNHARCPLCNYDLETATTSTTTEVV